VEKFLSKKSLLPNSSFGVSADPGEGSWRAARNAAARSGKHNNPERVRFIVTSWRNTVRIAEPFREFKSTARDVKSYLQGRKGVPHAKAGVV
jgi:hypothetical protein